MKKIILVTLMLCFFSSLSYNSMAASDLTWQRQQFQLALAAIEREDWTRVRQYADDLLGYPLADFLHYRYLQAHLHELSQTEVAAFLVGQQDSFMRDELNYAWLNHLIRNQDWQGLESAYTPQASERLRCYYLFGRLQQIKSQVELTALYQEDIVAIGKDLWLVGKSQHQACDPVFSYLEQENILNDEWIWQRLNLAVQAGKTNLARYLATKLSNTEHQAWALYWQELPSDPGSVLKKVYLKHIPEQVNASAMIAYGIMRLAKKQADKAAEHWQKFQGKLKFTPEQQAKVSAQIAIYSAFQERDQALVRLQKLSAAAHESRSEHLLLQMLLMRKDWAALETAINGLSVQSQNNSKFRYWLARALAAQGKNTAATETFKSLAHERDFYGYLAAERLQLPYAINHKPTLLNAEVETELYDLAPELIQAREFLYFDLITEAKRSWAGGLNHLNPAQMAQAAALARSWDWYDQGIITAAKARAYDDVEVRFPLAHYEEINTASKEQEIDIEWVYGIIRQESAFMRTATSHVGARGLMQLMPATQAMMAKKIGLSLAEGEIFDSASNIRLGTAYLKRLLDKFSGSYLLATIGYNAGPGRAQRWWKEYPNSEVDLWIEQIPFKETRRYVKQVLFYTALYEHQLGRDISPLRLAFPTSNAGLSPAIGHLNTSN